jgi:hypothetical protein
MRQTIRASPAINPLVGSTKPQGSARFTHLQLNANFVHWSFSRHNSPPAASEIFPRSNGHAQVAIGLTLRNLIIQALGLTHGPLGFFSTARSQKIESPPWLSRI